jgi:hypothetical protein
LPRAPLTSLLQPRVYRPSTPCLRVRFWWDFRAEDGCICIEGKPALTTTQIVLAFFCEANVNRVDVDLGGGQG